MKAMHSRYGAGPLERKDASGGEGAADTVEIKKALDGFSKTLDAFMKKTDQEIAEVKKTGTTDAVTQAELKKIEDSLLDQKKLVDQMRLDNARPVMMSPDGTKTMLTADQVEHKKQFERFFRKGVESSELQAFEAKTLNVGTDPDGGYTVPVQMERAIDRVVTEISPIRQIARVVQVSSASYRKLVSKGGATSGWVGEQSSRPNTETPRLDPMDFPVMELYANPAATQSLLDDSAINIEQWLADEVSIEFAQQEGRAFVTGNGSAKPRGFLSYDVVEQDSWSWNKLGYRATGVSGGFLATNPGDGATNIIDLFYSLKPAFRANARFVMNRKTISLVMKMRDADGQLLWGDEPARRPAGHAPGLSDPGSRGHARRCGRQHGHGLRRLPPWLPDRGPHRHPCAARPLLGEALHPVLHDQACGRRCEPLRGDQAAEVRHLVI
jgi:HK97 family phage major capsid protein